MTDLKTKQQNKHGGAREGGGRPKGSTSKLKVSDFFTPEEKEALVEKVKAMVLMADTPDKEIAKFLWEQIFGKATQRTEISGLEGEALRIIFDNSFNK